MVKSQMTNKFEISKYQRYTEIKYRQRCLFGIFFFGYLKLFDIWRLSHTTYFGTNPKQGCSDRHLIQIHYFCHPLYGKKVEIIAQTKRANDHFYVISFFDNSKVYLPTWMTDPLVCQQFRVEKEPSCSLTALQSLRAYLDCF